MKMNRVILTTPERLHDFLHPKMEKSMKHISKFVDEQINQRGGMWGVVLFAYMVGLSLFFYWVYR